MMPAYTAPTRKTTARCSTHVQRLRNFKMVWQRYSMQHGGRAVTKELRIRHPKRVGRGSLSHAAVSHGYNAVKGAHQCWMAPLCLCHAR